MKGSTAPLGLGWTGVAGFPPSLQEGHPTTQLAMARWVLGLVHADCPSPQGKQGGARKGAHILTLEAHWWGTWY